MEITKKSILIFMLCSCCCFLLQAEGSWIQLHTKADETSLKEALETVKTNASSEEQLYVLALCYLNLHQNNKAQETFERIKTLNPKSLKAKWGIAEVLRRQHQAQKSEEILKEILKEEPDFVPALITLAYIKHIKLQFYDSLKLVKKVLKMGKHNMDLSNYVRSLLLSAANKGYLAYNGGFIQKLIYGFQILPTIKKASALQPDKPEVLFGLGCFYLLAPKISGGDLNEAQKYLEMTIKTDPLFCEAYVRLAQIYKARKQPKKYELYLTKALQIDPQSELAIDIQNGTCNFICIDGKEKK